LASFEADLGHRLIDNLAKVHQATVEDRPVLPLIATAPRFSAWNARIAVFSSPGTTDGCGCSELDPWYQK
jgi:hypothetical protein